MISWLITLCGGENIFAALGTLAPVVNREAVLASDPQIIIASGQARERPDWLERWQAWPQVSAVRNQQLYVIDPDLIQRQAPRIVSRETGDVDLPVGVISTLGTGIYCHPGCSH